jgi:RNA-directed DNA polymerase
MNVALHGMEAVVAQGAGRAAPLLVRYADDFVILHSDLRTVQQAVKRVRRWLAMMGLQLHEEKTRLTHTLTPYAGEVGFDFLGFHIYQESREKHLPAKREQERVPASMASPAQQPVPARRPSAVKTVINPSPEATRRHLMAIEQRLQPLQTAPQARVIEELNPLITGWAAYYNGVIPAATMSRYDELLEQRLIDWASKRHPGQTRDWLLNRYWQRAGAQRRVFATHDGVQLRAYRQTSILRR